MPADAFGQVTVKEENRFFAVADHCLRPTRSSLEIDLAVFFTDVLSEPKR